LSIRQEDVVLRGHAIECRNNAEDASKNFAPAPGRITGYTEPAGPGVRVDSGVGPGSEVSPMYDPMIGKLIVWDADRTQATARMVRALREYEIGDLKTLLPFHEAILQTPQWANAETCRDLIEDRAWLKTLAFPKVEKAGDGEAPKTEQEYTVEVGGKRFEVKVIGSSGATGPLASSPAAAPSPNRGAARSAPRRSARANAAPGSNSHSGDALVSPLQGTIFKVAVEKGATVEEGALICVIEAMKMENEITAHKAGVVVELAAAVGAAVSIGDTLAVISSE
jgi:acetyl-CoA/propionyl-CoA carboxylase biotin carboxyl carrier protein